jgi:NAD(P) transhydrogenase subunit alpha
VPGKKAPVLVSTAMVEAMQPGSVIVDLAAERGGNCELTRAGETVHHHGVAIMGPDNLPASVPYHASQMYSKNISTFLLHLVDDGKLELSSDDEITAGTLITHQGEVVHPAVREALGLAPMAGQPDGAAPTAPEGSGASTRSS